MRFTAFIVASFCAAPAFAEDVASAPFMNGDHSGSVEVDYILDGKTAETLNALTTLSTKNKWSFGRGKTLFSLVANARFWVDAHDSKSYDPNLNDNLEKLVAYAEIPVESLQLQVGQLEVNWGENLLMPILDVVNQHDVNHPRGYYDPASKRPAQMVNAEWGTQDYNLQLVYVPKPEGLRQPDAVADFEVTDDTQYRRYHDAEYGGRAGIFLLGIDAKLYHFRHWARVPAYVFTPFSGDGDLQQADRLSETNGLSFSYAGYSWLVRGDIARHTSYPATNIGTAVEWSPLTQGILGFQITSEAQQSVSLELHHDHWDEEPTAWKKSAFVAEGQVVRDLSWIVLSSNLTFFDGKFEPFLLVMRGVQKNDTLIRLIPVWNARENLTLAVEYQKTKSESNSPKLLLDNRESTSFRLAWSF